MTASSNPAQTIAFQGAFGAYSDLACRRVFPEMATLPCNQFEDAFAAVREDRAALAMMPIENSVAGRVADIHHLDAGFGPPHHRRAFRAGEPSPAGPAGRNTG